MGKKKQKTHLHIPFTPEVWKQKKESLELKPRESSILKKYWHLNSTMNSKTCFDSKKSFEKVRMSLRLDGMELK